METNVISVDRHVYESNDNFDTVLKRVYKLIGRPGLQGLKEILAEKDAEQFSAKVNAAVGPSGLMEFINFDLGDALAKDPKAKPYRIVRIVAGNPLIMREMVATVPNAGAYAPVTILIYEQEGKVKLAYDSMVSYIKSFGSGHALDVAESLDRKVMNLLASAVSAPHAP